MTRDSDPLGASYARCRLLARRSRSSFYPAMLLLPPAKRRAMEALYAFLRHTDDLADSPLPLALRQARLERWRMAVSAVLRGAAEVPDRATAAPSFSPLAGPLSGTPAIGPCGVTGLQADEVPQAILPALADTVRRFDIPPRYLWAVLDGAAMDLDHRGFETFDELAEYCWQVASAVGRACLCIWGAHCEAALPLADQCGLAFQVTNILRDVSEDAARGRVYLPRADLAACGVSVEALHCKQPNAALERVVERLAERARAAYRAGADLFDLLDRDGQRVFGLMFSLYRHLLERVVRRRKDLLVRRVCLGRWQKLVLLARWTFLKPRKSALP